MNAYERAMIKYRAKRLAQRVADELQPETACAKSEAFVAAHGSGNFASIVEEVFKKHRKTQAQRHS